MSKTLDVNNMLDAATESEMPNIEWHIAALETAADHLAVALAAHLKIQRADRTNYQAGFGGLCASFIPARRRQKCPPVIVDKDEGGE